MSDKSRDITPEEAFEIIRKISGPTFKYMMKRVHNQVISNKDYSNISINSLISVLMTTLATIDSNALLWIANVYRSTTNQNIDMNKLVNGLILSVQEQVKTQDKSLQKTH